MFISVRHAAPPLLPPVSPYAPRPSRPSRWIPTSRITRRCPCCYIGPFILIPLIGAHESPYVRFHLNNGIWLYISYLICLIVPFVGWGAVVVLFVFNIIGIVKAAQGKFEGLPLLGKFAKFFK